MAWWGAILSTIVFAWDIYKYRVAGPRLRFKVQPGMELLNVPGFEGKTVVFLEVTNIGDRPTTITNFGLQYFEKKHWFRRNKPNKAAVITNPGITSRIPYELRPGTRWDGAVVQDGEIEKWAKGHLDVLLYHSHKDKPLRRRLMIHEEKNR